MFGDKCLAKDMRDSVTKTHRNLEAWERAMNLAREVYGVTRAFPKEEAFGLTSQARGAAVSIPCNIAEGAARGGTKEFIQFLTISRGSLAELQPLPELAMHVRLLPERDYSKVLPLMTNVSALIGGLIASLRRRLAAPPNTKH